jgi:hypothetical protein
MLKRRKKEGKFLEHVSEKNGKNCVWEEIFMKKREGIEEILHNCDI